MTHRVLAVCACLLLAGCVISEQDGQLVPQGNPRFTDQSLGEVVFHFDSTFNQVMVWGRAALLILLGVWLVRIGGGVPIGLGAIALVAALWLTWRDLPKLLHYRIAALESRLELEIPPARPRTLEWDQVVALHVEGFVAGGGGTTPGAGAFSPDLRDWRNLELELDGGERIPLDLEQLSIEQRETVWRAIAARAGLAEQK